MRLAQEIVIANSVLLVVAVANVRPMALPEKKPMLKATLGRRAKVRTATSPWRPWARAT